MRPVLLLEVSLLWRRLGGVRGLLLISALAGAGTLVPMRAGAAIFDPLYTIGYAIAAAFFAGSYSIQTWAGVEERSWIETLDGANPSAFEVLQAKSLAATVYGLASWIAVFGASVAALASIAGRLNLPPILTLAALALFVLALSAASSSAAALIAVRFDGLAQARQAFRLALWFVLLMGIIASRVAPGLLRPLENPRTLLLALIGMASLLGCASALLGWLILRSLADRRISLSIKP